MGTIYKGAIELVGKTPLVELVNLEKREGLKARLLAKVEYFNPAGSVKDRLPAFRSMLCMDKPC